MAWCISVLSSVLYLVIFRLALGSEGNIANIMEANKIVPDVIDVAPKATLQVSYPSGVVVDFGNELTPTQVKDQPTVTWEADDDCYYTLIMTDPDAPSRENPIVGEVRHWYVVNIPGNNVEKGEALFQYIGSGPPKDTGLHRYVFLVFRQSGLLEFDEKRISNKSRENRLNSKAREFVAKYNLGNPIAGNFYQAQFDDYVPIFREQFTE